MFFTVAFVGIISMFVYKKIEPDNYKLYIGYVIGIIIIAALMFEPWKIFGGV